MKSFLLALILMIGLPNYVFSYNRDDIFIDLDRQIKNYNQTNYEKLQYIDKLSHIQKSSLQEQYTINEQLYEEYLVYDSDSAMSYLQKNEIIANKLGLIDEFAKLKIKVAFIYSATGYLSESKQKLLSVAPLFSKIKDKEKLRQTKRDYFDQSIYLYSHYRQFEEQDTIIKRNIISNYQLKADEYTDSAYSIAKPSDKNYFWISSLYAISHKDSKLQDKLIKEISYHLLNNKDANRWEALNAYVLGRMYDMKGDRENYFKYLSYSAIIDIKIGNRDIASLQEIGEQLYLEKDYDRAYSYLNYCFTNSKLYKNRVRLIQISDMLNKTQEIISNRNIEQKHHLKYYLIITLFLLFICIFGLFYILLQNKKLSLSRKEIKIANEKLSEHMKAVTKAQKELEEVNEKLSSLNLELNKVNGQLCESNYVKEEYLGYVFNLCSIYIGKLDEFRKNINRKVKTNKIDSVLELTDSNVIISETTKEFYKKFDEVFLHIYPNFVDDFNKLLRPEEHILLKDPKNLTLELRIYALIRLGISDSVKIADFLHCSVQTIYNNRLRIRNKSYYPKENFVKMVKVLGKLNDKYINQKIIL